MSTTPSERGPLIGLSIPACIQEIVRGDISESDVTGILSTTALEGDEWKDVLDRWARESWVGAADRCRELFEQLLNSGKILQPREKGTREIHYTMGGNWVALDNLNTWLDRQRLSGDYKNRIKVAIEGIVKRAA